MGAKNSTERTLKNLEKMFGEDEDFLKKIKERKEKNDKDKNDKDNQVDNGSLLSKPIVKGGCNQCALKKK